MVLKSGRTIENAHQWLFIAASGLHRYMLNPIFFEKLSDIKESFGGDTKLFDICFCIVAHGYHVKFGADVDTRHLLMDNAGPPLRGGVG